MKKAILLLFIAIPLIISCGSEYSGPGVGPDCTLCWVSYRDGAPNIFTIDLPEGAPTKLTNLVEGCGRWGVTNSADNNVYFGGKCQSKWDVYMIDRQGGLETNMTNCSQFDGNPTVSPDCQYVCFMTKRWYFTYYDKELAIMNSDTREVTRLTHYEGSDEAPVWSPTEDRIAFVRTGYFGENYIYLATVFSPDSVAIQMISDPYMDAWNPRWTPDGESIICVMADNGIRDIWKIDVGGDMTNLTNSTNSDEKPEVSPDGSEVVHQVFRNHQWDIAVTSMDGETRFITENLAEDISPCWSPDGDWIFWVSYRDGDREIYAIPADCSDGPFRITFSEGDDIRPQCWAN